MSALLMIDHLHVWYHELLKTERNDKVVKTKIVQPVHRDRPHKYVVKDLCLTVEKGEVMGLVGPSGCGKTTVAWSVMGMIERMGGHVNGKITFLDTVILDHTYRQQAKSLWWKEIAIVPQASMSAFNPSLTIGETLVETMRAHGKPAQRADCHKLMEMVCLENAVLELYPHEMSGGMKQRAAIAVAMCLSPKLLILDEATTGLDVLVEADILKTIKELQAQKGMAILMISHDRRLTSALCDRIYKLEVVKHDDEQYSDPGPASNQDI